MFENMSLDAFLPDVSWRAVREGVSIHSGHGTVHYAKFYEAIDVDGRGQQNAHNHAAEGELGAA